MINRFADHAANERTYLAWIRTAIAIMAFGFVIEKFDLFLRYMGRSMGEAGKQMGSMYADVVGLALIFISMVLLLLSTVRYFGYRKAIDSDTVMRYGSRISSVVIGLMMVMLATFLLVYLGHKIQAMWGVF